MAKARPFPDAGTLLKAARDLWRNLGSVDWLEAFSHHALIGDKLAVRTNREQAGVRDATGRILDELASGNRDYEKKFGHVFLICATGKSADEMLALLKARLGNQPGPELRIAAGEHEKITEIRLQKLLGL